MTRHLPFFVLDVFTRKPFSGNPLAIVEEANALTTAQMQVIAREFNLSETIFAQEPADPAHAARVRIFFPTAEIPFAGHPTIGCAIHLARKAAGSVDDFAMQIVLEEEAGLVPVTVTCKAGMASAQFTAPVIPHPHSAATPPADLAASALGLAADDIGFGKHGVGIFAGGPAFLYVPVRGRQALARARPCEPQWSQLMEIAGVDSAYLYCSGADGIDYRARMFSPTAGIPEDPATGSATAILSAQLLASGALGEGTTSLALVQGEEMGRRSELLLEVDMAGGAIMAVRVAGSAVPISSGSILVP